MNEKACRKCRKLIEEKEVVDEKSGKLKKEVIKTCPVCGATGTNNFTTFWKGTAYIIDPDNSEVGKKMDVKTPGRYALRLSR
ncbi:MAG: transcription elongation factor subunit Spt4 [archaeon]